MIRYVLTAVVLCFFCASPAFPDIYKYVDENGVVCYTDAPATKRQEQTQRVMRTTPEKQESRKKKTTVSYARPAGNPDQYRAYVSNTASRYEIEPELIHAVIKTESNWNHRAVSRKGAIGLMQLMPTTASDMQVSNPYNPEENIEGGTRYLRYLLEKFNGNLTLALAAYNAGPKTVEKYQSVPPILETREYVKRVLSLYRGKQQYALADTSVKPPAPVQIFRVVLEDGTILFTNSNIAKSDKNRL